MMNRYLEIKASISNAPRVWLITGVAGFIGSNLLEALLKLNQKVIGLDNFSTGHQVNLDQVRDLVSIDQWGRFQLIEGDICDSEVCYRAASGADYVLHQAALGSVPRSIADPVKTNECNIAGFLNMIVASRDAAVSSFTYAASSSTYGDHPGLPKIEATIGNPLSPYAVTKYVNELYAGVFSKCYDFNSIGLRYFNVFGPRQDPNGAYAAVIPKWISAMLNGQPIRINGDGETSRDFCYVENVVQANLLAALAPKESKNEIYNVALGDRTSLFQLYGLMRDCLSSLGVEVNSILEHSAFRSGDVKHSQADVSKVTCALGYKPTFNIRDGMKRTCEWYSIQSQR